MRKELNSQRIFLVHQHGRHFIVLEQQYGRRGVMWKSSIVSSLLRLERKQKKSSNAFRVPIYSFRSYSFEIETVNPFTRSRWIPNWLTGDPQGTGGLNPRTYKGGRGRGQGFLLGDKTSARDVFSSCSFILTRILSQVQWWSVSMVTK